MDYMDEITEDDLYKGLLAHGLFCEKLPPVFSTESFYEYCDNLSIPFEDKPRQFISYESMRNINVPRQMGIPNPMAYQRLCSCLADNWYYLKKHFKEKTIGENNKISRIHIRKLKGKARIFEMNYKSWKLDGSSEPDVLVGKRFLVKADIATCFPSIYTHSLTWALVGKGMAKRDRKGNQWFNKIDHFAQQIKNGETHGLLIGPHASNILSEIILTCIDFELTKQGWEYIRNIDDYSCYVKDCDEGQKFIVELNKQLRNYDLLLNHKKTEILNLPTAIVEQWVRQINSVCAIPQSRKMNYKDVQAYMDVAIELMQSNKNNAAILKYAIKVLSGKTLTDNAKKYCAKIILHLAFIYPYLVPLLEKKVFNVFNVKESEIAIFSEILFKESLRQQNFEAVFYAIYYAIKWDFKIDDLTAQNAINTKDCFVMLFAFKYFEKIGDKNAVKNLRNYAEELKKTDDFDRYWMFIYEILPKSKLVGDWKPMKDKGVTFMLI